MKRCVAMALLMTLLVGCDARRERLTGPYLLLAIDAQEESHIAFDLGSGTSIQRIPPVVFEVGWDERYIVAKQHAEKSRDVAYYFLEIAKDSSHADPRKSVTGPLSKQAFDAKKAELKLPEFRRKLKHLE